MFSSLSLNVNGVPRPLNSVLQAIETRITLHLELTIRGLRHSGWFDSTEIAVEGL